MKQLHLANIANMAYSYGKMLRASGVEADVLCYDLGHVLSLPAWVEGDFDIPIDDEWRPDLGRPEIAAIDIPTWYRQVRSADVALPSKDDTSVVWSWEWVDQIVQASKRFGPRWEVRHEDVTAYRLLVERLQAHYFGGYELIFGYAYGAVPPLLASTVPYVPVEIGTLRDTVNIDSPLGRLLALAYRTAPHTIITNADCEAAARSLGLQNYSYVPHPVDEDVFRPISVEERAEIRQSFCGSRDSLLIAPARQAWDVKANDHYLRAFAEFVRTRPDVKLLIAHWGPDVGRAKALIQELRIGEFVSWFSPAPERRLARLFAAADLVLDQFGTFGTFGLIAPKAMACGAPCLLSFEPQLHAWCLDEPPPLISAGDEQEILHGLQHYLSDAADRELRGRQSREWVLKHNSKRVVAEKMRHIAQAVTSSSRPRVGFDDLRACRSTSFQRVERPRRLEPMVAAARHHTIRLRRAWRFLKQTLIGLRYLRVDRERLGHVERALHADRERIQQQHRRLEEGLVGVEQALHADRERIQQQHRRLEEGLVGVEQALHADRERIQQQHRRLEEGLVGVEQALHADRERIQQQHRRLGEGLVGVEQALQADRERIQQQNLRLEESHGQFEQAIKNTFDVMGQNRIADHKTIAAVRTELLEALVRSRLALPFRLDSSATAPPRMYPPLTLVEARSKLAAAAPLNWETYVDCLQRGMDSYESFPPGSCSTAAHSQADLFRAFLRPYLRGQVLDVGCGPQPLPWYLSAYPLDLISGIDPISEPSDHAFHFVSGFGEFLPWDDEQFDVVISGTSLDHYYLLDVGLREAFRVLRPGGYFVAWIGEFAGAPAYNPYDRAFEVPYDLEHLYHIDRAWLLPLMANVGFVETEILHFDLPFNYLFMSFERPPPGAESNA